MTQSGYSGALVNLMLGWLKGLASWVLKLFNLAGSGGSPLLWLSRNWLKLLILCMIVGILMDWLVWMIRWRPYWVWFRKKRIVVNDEKFLSGAYDGQESDDGFERRYVVPSTIVRKAPEKSSKRPVRRPAPVQRPVQRRRVDATVPRRNARPARPVQTARRRPVQEEMFSDELFEVGHSRQEYSDFYEDEVFNVSNLPERSETVRKNRKRHR